MEKVEDKLTFLFSYISGLKEENRELKRKVYSLELNLAQAKSAAAPEGLKTKHSSLIEERDRLMMERELIRKKMETLISRIDNIIEEERAAS
ncbi:MAG: hypothetical protein HZB29_11010 [Nitrospinae bacterium]|nr:hypothetical protein [Nitrospinota bacterium]